MRSHRLRGSVVVLFSVLVIGALPSMAQQPIRIGVSLSITGKQYSVQGGYGREGYLLCQKHVNAQGGVLGRPVEFVIYDDGGDHLDMGEGAPLPDHDVCSRRRPLGGAA